jgi:hypothetical protein
MAQSVCRVVIRKAFHDYLNAKAKELCTNDMGEVVNHLVLLQMKQELGGQPVAVPTTTQQSSVDQPKEEYSDLSGLLA